MRKRPVVRARWLYGIVFAVLVASFVWTQITVQSLGDDLEKSRADSAALAKQVKQLGGTPTVAPSPIKGVSNDDVRAIVTDELSKSKIDLTQTQVSQIARVAAAMVPKPKDGITPSSTQVQGVVSATITAFCAQASQPCRGKEGLKGKDAPPITEAQLSAVVGAFCGADAVNCRGPRGEAGSDGRGIKSVTKSGETVTVTYTDGTTDTFTVPDGKDGAAGRGIAKIECQDDGTWLFTYTDGTTATVDGPCRVHVVPSLPPG